MSDGRRKLAIRLPKPPPDPPPIRCAICEEMREAWEFGAIRGRRHEQICWECGAVAMRTYSRIAISGLSLTDINSITDAHAAQKHLELEIGKVRREHRLGGAVQSHDVHG